MNVILTSEQAAAVASALRELAIRSRTGELGVLHGMDRFVATGCPLKKEQRATLDEAARKLGLTDGVRVVRS